ncbi:MULTISPECIES: condensation domain-containing protein [unclassified Streptomyces]|uniref:condensation domain-containing protein n=1 Tax=unclassified Streptomyces TaxID=2593676 RepID=UPI002E29C7C6|nr:condensation domain-containing protein [Streptomyces sp. NBC_00223]
MRSRSRVALEFAGGRTGTASLTWGQRAIWRAIERTRPGDHYFNSSRTLRLDGNRAFTVPQVLAALRQVVERHEALRTRLVPGADEPRQQLYAAGEMTVDLVGTGTPGPAADKDNDTVAAVAQRLAALYCARGYDYTDAWPVRIGIVAGADNLPRAVVMGFCHVATDYTGSGVVMRDLAAALDGTLAPAPGAVQPLDLARHQESPDGRRRAEASARWWERSHQRIPVSMFEKEHFAPEQPRFQRLELISPALAKALPGVAARASVSTATTLIAASAAALRELTGHRICALLAISGNRVGATVREMVSTLSMEALLVVEVDGADTFDELQRRAGRATLAGYRHGDYDERDRERVVAAESAVRGAPVHPYCCVNDLRTERRGPGAATRERARPRELLDRTRLRPLSPLERLGCRFCLHIADAPGGLSLQVTADTGYLPVKGMRDFALGVERLVVSAADGDVALSAPL